MLNERQRPRRDDEIELVDLVRGIWRQKVWVGLVAAPIVAAGVAYALMATPVYEVKLFVEPPTQNDIAQLNIGRGRESGLSPVTVKEVYETHLQALQSEAVRNTFFRDVYLPSLSEEQRRSSRDALYGGFNKALTVASVGNKGGSARYAISAVVSDPQQATKWLVAFNELAAESAKLEVIESSRSDMLIKAGNLESQINSAKSSAREEREDRIAQLKEALVVAKSVGLDKPPLISEGLSGQVCSAMGGALTYLRGSKALEAEIATLEARSSDEPFIKGLREKQEEVKFYRDLKLDPSAIRVFGKGDAVELPGQPIRPKKSFIVLLSLVLGLGAGFFIGIVKDFWSRRGAPKI